jgi:hypothetical protein
MNRLFWEKTGMVRMLLKCLSGGQRDGTMHRTNVRQMRGYSLSHVGEPC